MVAFRPTSAEYLPADSLLPSDAEVTEEFVNVYVGLWDYN